MAEPVVVACLRHADPRLEVAPLTGAVRRSGHGAGPAPAELAALELALRVAQSWQGRVLAVVAGPPAGEATLREALAAGAEVLRIDWPDADYLADLAADEQALASALADAIRDRQPALVLCGDRSADRGTGALPAFLAHELDAAQALGLVSLEVAGDELAGERRLPGGRRERLRIPRPAVCSVEAAGVRLRRAPLAAALAAGRAAVPVVSPSVVSASVVSPSVVTPAPTAPTAPAVVSPGVVSPGAVSPAAAPSRLRIGPVRPYSPRTHEVPAAPEGSARDRLLSLSGALTRREPPAVIGPADPGQAAGELLAYLRRAGYLSDDLEERA